MIELVVYSLVGGLFSLFGGFLLLLRTDWAKKVISSLLAFAAGAFIAVSFLDLLPEAIETTTNPRSIFMATLAGFSVFFVLERILMKYVHGHNQNHKHSEHTESLPFLLVLGDTLHNFLDGIVIAIAYIADPTIGLVTTLAVTAHEIPQEIGDFVILLNAGWKTSKIILVNVISSLATVLGVVLGYYGGIVFESSLPLLLGSVSGVFIYIAASDLIPEIHHQSGHKHMWRILIPFFGSVGLIWFLITVSHPV